MMERRWQKAKKLNTLEAYEEIIQRNPDGPYAKDARDRIELIYFQLAKNNNTIKSIQDYLDRYPNGRFKHDVINQLEKVKYDEALSKNTLASYQGFLTQFPNTKYIEVVLSKIEILHFKKAEDENSIYSYKNYLSNYPNGKFASKANHRIESLIFENAKKMDTISAYNEFLKQFPNSEYAINAQERKERLYYEIAKEKNTIASYNDYLNRYPNGNYKLQCENYIKELIDIRDYPNVLYFYFAPYGCPYSKAMASTIERFYQEYGEIKAARFIDDIFSNYYASLDLFEKEVMSDIQIPIQSSSYLKQKEDIDNLIISNSIVEVTRKKFKVYGVPIHSRSHVDSFKSSTGITFPIISRPTSLNVDTSSYPVTAVYNRQTSVVRVAAVGDVSYSRLVSKVESIRSGKSTITPARGGA